MSALFGGGSKSQGPSQIIPPKVEQPGAGDAVAKKQIGRASLFLTSPQGILDPATTASGKLLGN